MAQFDRTKKLTSYVYSPTDPASEDAIRLQVDNSIQEVSDILYSQDAGKGASQVGINGLAYSTVQDLAQVVSDSGTGTAPPADSVGLAQQAPTVKTGLLADLLTTIKTSIVASINEIYGLVTTKATALVDGIMSKEYAGKLDGFNSVTLSAEFATNSTTAVDTGLSMNVEAGKTYQILINGLYKNTSAARVYTFGLYMPTGSGTISGNAKTAVSATAITPRAITAIGASGLAGSEFTTNNAVLNVLSEVSFDVVFKCASSGSIRLSLKSANTDSTVTISALSSLIYRKLD